jgi:hypothetical protein
VVTGKRKTKDVGAQDIGLKHKKVNRKMGRTAQGES